MVVRRRDDPDDVDLRHGTVARIDSATGRGDLALQESDHFAQRLVVSLEDECLGSRVRDAPEY